MLKSLGTLEKETANTLSPGYSAPSKVGATLRPKKMALPFKRV
jgi:hypothetical protein